MNKTLLLVKTSLRESLDTRKFKENKAKTASFGVFVGGMGLLFVALATLYSVIYAMMFREMGYSLIYEIAVMGGVASMLILITSITRSKGLFLSKDYEMLRAMPFTKREIVSSKLISLYFTELIYAAIILIPCCIVCSVIENNFFYAILMIPVTLLLPGLPVVVGCLIGLFVALVADRSRFANLISILFYVAFLAVFMVFSGALGVSAGEGSMGEEGAMETFLVLAKLNPTLLLLIKAWEENFLLFIAYVVSNLAALALSVWIMAGLFDRVYAVVTSAKGNVKYKEKTLKQKGAFATLFKNEAKRYFSSRLYCVNTLVSGIAAVVVTAMLCFSVKPMLEEDPEFLAFIKDYAYLAVLLIAFVIGFATPASISISMEGNTFWLTKTLPIDFKQLVKAKIWFSTLILGAFAILSSVLFAVLMESSAVSALSLILTSFFFVLGASSLGLLLNTSFYKLKWKNEMEVVKNSSAVIVSMLADMGITIVLVGIGVASVFLPAPFGSLVLTVAVAIFGLLTYFLAVAKAGEKIRKIEDF